MDTLKNTSTGIVEPMILTKQGYFIDLIDYNCCREKRDKNHFRILRPITLKVGLETGYNKSMVWKN